MYIVLMAGGIGTRFWPRSRISRPKQMLNIFGNKSMLRMTYTRIKGLTEDEKILVITNAELTEKVREDLPELPAQNIIAEPFGRNTAPCIGLAASIIQKRNRMDDEVMVVLPADHLIEEEDNFRETLHVAAQYARDHQCLITMGITPSYPETGYGYIQKDKVIATELGKKIYKVKTFAEKPNIDIAKRFIQSGDFLWNSGMFIWTTESIMANFDEHQPDLIDGLHLIREAVDTPRMDEVIFDVYSRTKSISIDYGILEVASNVCVIEADFKWNDIGSWEAVYNISQKDKNGNAVFAGDHLLLDAKNNYFYSSKKLITAIDVENLVVVETDDAILICRKDRSQRVKDLVDVLRRKERYKYL